VLHRWQRRPQPARLVISANVPMSDIPKPKRKIGTLAFLLGSTLFALVALGASVALAVFLIRLIFWF
jgi:hypothetical protein